MLHLAIENGDYDMVEFLLQDERCDVDIVNEIGQSPLVTAVIMADLEMVKLLVKAGADLDLQDISGKTALLHALGDCNVDIAEYLINHGCDVNLVDSLGQSALYSVINALDFKCIKIVKKLLKAGYTLEKDKVWMEEEGLDVQMTHSTNIITKIFRKIAGKLHKLKVHQITAATLNSPQQTGMFPMQQRILKIYG
ncbi:hypothetical protein FSP39_011809 [Pinctada imbricata]|uniref:Uncharacterized protein n=1 Tax=Pinctada imbricata TaxID=66713 RepID=A0AA88XL16_PINIB|nr:hypothetical protein FSP39_011809 [Pinctada imbricata]